MTACDQASLQSALNAGGQVTMACDGVIALTSPLSISVDVEWDAAGHEVVLDGQNLTRLVNVSTGVMAAMRGLALANALVVGTNGLPAFNGGPGESVQGGGIFNKGNLVLTDCSLSNLVARGGQGGSGDLVGLTGAGGNANGGGIYNEGTLTATNCRFHGCLAQGGRGGSSNSNFGGSGGQAEGGAIYNADGSVLLVMCQFTENEAAGGLYGSTPLAAGTIGYGRGGAVASQAGNVQLEQILGQKNRISGSGTAGGFIFAEGSTTVLNHCQLVQNRVTGLSHDRGDPGKPARGGAVCSLAGSLWLENCSLDSNTVQGGNPSEGGGLYAESESTITGCCVSRNLSRGSDGYYTDIYHHHQVGIGYGGGIVNAGLMRATNCTIAINQVRGGDHAFSSASSTVGGDSYGGGFFQADGDFAGAYLTLADNSARGGIAQGIINPSPFAHDGFAYGGGIAVNEGLATLTHTILDRNIEGTNCFGTIQDGGYNLSSDTSCPFDQPGSLIQTDPLLGSLADNGGLTQTMALLPDSRARDGGGEAPAPPTDQRGVPRPQGNRPDIGAYEFGYVLTVYRSPSGLVLVSCLAQPNVEVTLWVTTDLKTWSILETKTSEDGHVTFEITQDEQTPFACFALR